MKHRQSYQSVPSYGIGYWIGWMLLATVIMTLPFYLMGHGDKVTPFSVGICLIGILTGNYISIRRRTKRLAKKSEKEYS
ncbi:MAG: hypothetical protein PF588_04630 [Candidatus Kapabacteria bacterium]|jgi:uncharacterized membrane protein (DUF106 family)|nr:hypothetical protein [Candidatus Kapabacteria bacterium]